MLCERLIQDKVSTESYAKTSDANGLVVEILNRYKKSLSDGNIFDFALMEERFLERLQEGTLHEWTSDLKSPPD